MVQDTCGGTSATLREAYLTIRGNTGLYGTRQEGPDGNQTGPDETRPDPKLYSIWIPEVGTSRGHEHIIDQSCVAVILFPDSSHRDLSASNLPGLIQCICDPLMPEILAN